MRTCCPSCNSEIFVKNGFSRHGDQNHRCLECGRQFVLDPQNKIISDETRDMVRKLLLEKLSLQGICRVTNVSQKWLLDFIKQEYARTPRDLNVQVPPDSLGLVLERLEADELWSFVGKKKNQVWIWLALDALTRQVVAIHAGGRSEEDAKAFWAEVPEPYRSGCDVYTDEWEAYRGAIPFEVHFAVKKSLGKPASLKA
jgi:IS1 family transposase/DNA-directed RNA polymerase subunit RPC12/RpoP